jgi:hypothetical protein
MYYLVKEVKLGREDLSNIPPPGRAPDEGLNDCIGKVLKKDPHLLAKTIAKALNISSTTLRKLLTQSLGMKCYHT